MHQTTKGRGVHSSPSFLNVAARADLGVDSELHSLPSNRASVPDALRDLGNFRAPGLRAVRCSQGELGVRSGGPAYRAAARDWLVSSNLQLGVGAAGGVMADEQELPAYPIRAYQLIPDPNQPTVVALAIETDQGHSLFLATRQILEDLGKDLLERAAKMPLKKHQA